MNIDSIIWVVAAVALGIIEGVTLNLVTIWPAIGAVCAAIAAAFGLGLLGQLLIFIGVSVVLLLATRPLALRLLSKKKEPTNFDRMVGAEARVIQRIDPIENRGQIKVLGQVWSAVAADGGSIEADEAVVVVAVRGVKAVVKKSAGIQSLLETEE